MDIHPWGHYGIFDDEEDREVIENLIHLEEIEVEEPITSESYGEGEAKGGLHKGRASSSHHSRSARRA